jgi:Ca2+-binding RTX toxin-like protein
MATTSNTPGLASQSVNVDLNTSQATFTLTFNSPPDFFTVDSANRQADSFQYYVDADGEIPVPRASSLNELEAIIRGDEIARTNRIVIRDVQGDGGPNAGGWGPERGSVPFTINGSTLTFTLALSLIGDSNGDFSYNIESFESGTRTDSINNVDVATNSPTNVINGTNRDDSLFGTTADEEINGLAGWDRLTGGGGSDTLNGGNGRDRLTGSDPASDIGPDDTEIDILTGGGNADTFIVGDANAVYYDSLFNPVAQDRDYAVIADFEPGVDVIQLRGSAERYQLQELSIGDRTGTGVVLLGGDSPGITIPDRLLALVEGESGLSLNSSNFTFV